eukprot:TRINITY_DN19950_c0_g2_i1.p1 TRINITY_DN19950_c0_g2~~TRINITY_DN19950_c0_g2_i1.p1  ORF type:complete len:462 (+),score=95.93 TRINITY_DN19950_c0_g2_i1:38-1387(+)
MITRFLGAVGRQCRPRRPIVTAAAATPCWRAASSGGARAAASAGLAASAALLAFPVGSAVAASDDLSHELSADEQRTVALFEKCSASVVHINTFVEKQGYFRSGRGYRLDLQEIPQGTGSGFMWDREHVVTNFHVIKDADKAMVVLSDHTTLEASLVGAEPDADLAVLKLKRPVNGGQPSLKPLDRGRSNNLHVGQKVFAIGNPFGLDQTLTSGIVSGLGREMKGVTGRTIRGLVQTDAAINPGNSGGPLLDARGRLIGVNTMIASPSGAFAGVGFAIPVDTVVRIVQQLVQFGRTKHAYLGLFCVPDHVKRRFSQQLKQNDQAPLEGVLVLNVEPESPADKAGIQPCLETRRGIKLGDEILAVDGRPVATVDDLLAAIEERSVGDEVGIAYRRRDQAGGAARNLRATVRLDERPGRHDWDAVGGVGHRSGVAVSGSEGSGAVSPRSRL